MHHSPNILLLTWSLLTNYADVSYFFGLLLNQIIGAFIFKNMRKRLEKAFITFKFPMFWNLQWSSPGSGTTGLVRFDVFRQNIMSGVNFQLLDLIRYSRRKVEYHPNHANFFCVLVGIHKLIIVWNLHSYLSAFVRLL